MSKVAVIGLGYVGLPLAVAFGRRGHDVVGFDVQTKKLQELGRGEDLMGEVSSQELSEAKLHLSSDASDIAGCEYVVVAVPTPVNASRQPDLTPLVRASETIAPHLSNAAVVIYESTVYPGVTEDVCCPILEAAGKKRGVDFRLGYSPERINPGDREHTIHKIIKVVSAEDEKTLDGVAQLYESIVDAGVYRAESIMVAEAAKVIENTQRDLNIALMNELSIIFEKIGIRTRDVLKAAGTKWNFLNFYPGLVGGHCIGVDPYYLTHRAEALGYTPQVITAGRRINDGMSKVVAEKTIKMMIANGSKIRDAKVLVLGTTFKEDVPDFRNSKVTDLIAELLEYKMDVSVNDPFLEVGEAVPSLPELSCVDLSANKEYDAVILAVGHKEYRAMAASDFRKFYSSSIVPVMIDIQAILNSDDWEEGSYWQL